MRPDHKPPRRRREMVGWYLIIAGFNAVFYVVLAAALTKAGLKPGAAGAAALLPVLAVSYLGHKRKTFRSPGAHRREAPRFVMLSAIDLLLAAAVPQIGLHLRAPAVTAFVLLTALVPAVNFILMRFWVFRDAHGG
jgi:putative flippase GtrA